MKRAKRMTEGEKIASLWFHESEPSHKNLSARIDRLLARERNRAAWDGWQSREESRPGDVMKKIGLAVMQQKYGPRKGAKG